MKKLILGSLLFAMGMFGVIAMLAAAILTFSDRGWLNYLDFLKYERGVLAPFIFFCLMSIAGLAVFVAKPIKKFVANVWKNN